MKNIQYILPFTLLLAACSQPAEILYPEADFASVKLSSGSAVISEDGGEKTVFVATNREEWDVQCIEDWVDISVEDNKITVYVDENPDKDSRLAVVDVIAGTKPEVAKARLKVLQKGAATADLSATGTANSYIAHTNASFRFDASVKGNGADDGNTFYIGYHGLEITEAAYADLAWESTFDADKTRSTKIISGAPVYSQEEQAVYFSTGEIQGNAVISVHDAEGEILWSWHIWVSDEPVKTSRGNGLEWMDRNLGALNNDPEDMANRGMLYQWGRKDPFLPSPEAYREVPFHTYDEEGNLLETEEEYYAIQAQIEQARVALNISNTQTGDGSLEWEYVSVAPVALQAPGNIEHSVQNPTTFLGCRTDIPIGEYVFDWYLQQDLVGKNGSLQQSQSDLWGYAQAGTAYKTIFDPCPPGYAVPPRGAFDDIQDGYACTYVDREWERNAYGWTWKGGNGDYFPSTGNLDVSGLIGETSEKMLYWTAETFGSGANGFGKAATLFVAFNEVYYGIYPILDAAEAAAWYSYGAKCFAAPVRCVKE
ncbi:MAG: BACON domain-containing protein [Bacteroidales bacterium]|nr:BACON domain-containing protein [Bacteroidales bacterium]